MVNKNKHIIIQARTSSKRLPAKVVRKINNKSLLEILIQRVKKTSNVDKIIIATSNDRSDNQIEKIAFKTNVFFYRGSLNDVLDRYYKASIKFKSDIIIRITGDCPLIDHQIIEDLVIAFEKSKVDYLSNTLDPQYPDGQDVEIFSFSALRKAWEKAELNSEREHVTPFIYNNSTYFDKSLFKSKNYNNKSGDYSSIRMTIDYENDFKIIKSLIENGGDNLDWKSYVELYNKKKLSELNNYKRNLGYLKSLANEK